MRLQDLLSPSDRFLKVVGGCGTCPRKLQDFVPATLRQTKLIIVGEAPGADEVIQQEGFVGKSGQVLRAALKDVGIDEYSLTNTVHCRPPENRDPDPKEISACLNQHVLAEVGKYSLACLVGNVAIGAFFPGHVQQVKGHLAYHPDFPNTRFFSMLHPAAVGYDPRRKDEFYGQVGRLGRIFHGEAEAPFNAISGERFRLGWKDFLDQAVILSLDLETDRLESWDTGGVVKSLAACSIPDNGEVFLIDRTDPYWDAALDCLALFLQNPEKQVLGQNIGFDLVWLEEQKKFKCNVKHIHDLQVLYYELKGMKQAALKPLVAEQLDGYRHLVVWPHLEKDLNRLKLYNGEDVWYPKDLFLRDFPRLRPRTRDLVLRVLGPSSLALRRITHAGIYFRSEAWEPLHTEFQQLREKAITDWQAMVPEVNIRRYVTPTGFSDLEEYIYTVRKYPVTTLTPKEQRPATDDSTIKELVRNGAKDLQFCLDIKGIDKRISTYIKAYPKLVTRHRRIHSSYHNTRVDTSRTSSSDPNMQNNPRLDPAKKNQIRWLFGAPPGSKFLSGDFSQVELRIGMSLANDPVGIKVYKEGGDIHIETARFIMGDEPNDPADWKKGKWKDGRTKAKSANFCVPLDSEILTRSGWKKYNEVLIGDETLGFDGERMKWTKVTGVTYFEDEPLIRIGTKQKWHATTTPNHRWYGDKLCDHGRKGWSYDPKVFTTEQINQMYRIWLSRPLDAEPSVDVTPDEAAVIGWLYTDGSHKWSSDGRKTAAGKDGQRRGLLASIAQNPEKFADDIRNLLHRVGIRFNEGAQRYKTNSGESKYTVVFALKSDDIRKLLRRAGLEHGTLSEFVLRLGTEQLKEFTIAIRHAEGTFPDYIHIGQNEGPERDAIELALFLSGYYVTQSSYTAYTGKRACNLNAGLSNVTGMVLKKTPAGRGPVWCPTTELGSWVMKQDGQIMVTGNCLEYGGSPYALQSYAADEFGVVMSDEESRRWHRGFFDRYPGLLPWHEKEVMKLRENKGYVVSETGHVWYYRDWDAKDQGAREHAQRQAINMTCQGPAANMMCYLIYLIQQAFWKARIMAPSLGFAEIVLTVHDSLAAEVGSEQVEDAKAIVFDQLHVVEDWIKGWFKVPLILDLDVSEIWDG